MLSNPIMLQQGLLPPFFLRISCSDSFESACMNQGTNAAAKKIASSCLMRVSKEARGNAYAVAASHFAHSASMLLSTSFEASKSTLRPPAPSSFFASLFSRLRNVLSIFSVSVCLSGSPLHAYAFCWCGYVPVLHLVYNAQSLPLLRRRHSFFASSAH